jgi:hypothetical protein
MKRLLAIDGLLVLEPWNSGPASYDTTLTAAKPHGDGVEFAAAGAQRLRYNTLASTSGTPAISLRLVDSFNGSVSYVSLATEYAGDPFAFDRANGTTYAGTYPSTDQTITA